jgi:alpha(1,3/1,4) fucosyltransferase
MNIAIHISDSNLLKDGLFDINNARDNILERYVVLQRHLKVLGHNCHTLDFYDYKNIDVFIFYRLDLQIKDILTVIKYNPYVKLFYIAPEPPLICHIHSPHILEKFNVDRIFTWNDDAIILNVRKIIKINFGTPVINPNSISNMPFTRRAQICAIFSNKTSNGDNELYSERLSSIKYIHDRNNSIDLYGYGWDSSTDDIIKRCYKGVVANKTDVLSRYRYSLCYENSNRYNGYISEKMFDSFASGCIPVYYGARNIEKYIPRSCYIDVRDYEDMDALMSYIESINEGKYISYISAITKFIQSPEYLRFTSIAYANTLIQEINNTKSFGFKRSIIHEKLLLLVHIIKNIRHYIMNIKETKRFMYNVVSFF